MSEEPIVRTAASKDLEATARLAGALVRQHHAVDPARFFQVPDVEQGYAHWFSRELARDAAIVLVADLGGEIVGYCYGSVEGRDWSRLLDAHGAIHDLFVAPSHRQRGIGKKLLSTMVERFHARGAERVVLSTMVSNMGAQRLFEACGFRPTMLEMTR